MDWKAAEQVADAIEALMLATIDYLDGSGTLERVRETREALREALKKAE